MKVKYTRTETYEFDTEKLEEFYEIENEEDLKNLKFCKFHCDSLIGLDFINEMEAKYTRESKIEKI